MGDLASERSGGGKTGRAKEGDATTDSNRSSFSHLQTNTICYLPRSPRRSHEEVPARRLGSSEARFVGDRFSSPSNSFADSLFPLSQIFPSRSETSSISTTGSALVSRRERSLCLRTRNQVRFVRLRRSTRPFFFFKPTQLTLSLLSIHSCSRSP